MSRAVFKTVGGREGVPGRFDSCLFRRLHRETVHEFAGPNRGDVGRKLKLENVLTASSKPVSKLLHGLGARPITHHGLRLSFAFDKAMRVKAGPERPPRMFVHAEKHHASKSTGNLVDAAWAFVGIS